MSNNIASKDLIIDLICFSLITSNVEHLSMHLFVDHVFSFIRYIFYHKSFVRPPFSSLPIFFIGLFTLLWSFRYSESDTCFAKIYLVLWLTFKSKNF